MRVFHIGASDTTIAKRTSASLGTLQASLSQLCEAGLAEQDFERFEREVHALFIAAERELLADELEALDIDVPEVIIGGQRHRQVLRSSETYTSAVGPVTVRRALYRAGKGKSVVPMELRAGMVEGH